MHQRPAMISTVRKALSASPPLPLLRRRLPFPSPVFVPIVIFAAVSILSACWPPFAFSCLAGESNVPWVTGGNIGYNAHRTEISAYAAETQYTLDNNMELPPWTNHAGEPVSFVTADGSGNTVVDTDAISNWLNQEPLYGNINGWVVTDIHPVNLQQIQP